MPKRVPDTFNLEAALKGLAAPATEPVEAGFFHRTLARWLGLAEGRLPGARAADVSWSYSFWKAELVRLWANGGRQIWTAQVFRGPVGPAETYEYWIDLDARARIKRSGWLSSAPDLLADGGGFAPPPIDQGAVSRLFDEAGDDSGDDAP